MKAKLFYVAPNTWESDANCIDEFETTDENIARIKCILKYGAKCSFHNGERGKDITVYRAYHGNSTYLLYLGENLPDHPTKVDGKHFLTEYGKQNPYPWLRETNIAGSLT